MSLRLSGKGSAGCKEAFRKNGKGLKAEREFRIINLKDKNK